MNRRPYYLDMPLSLKHEDGEYAPIEKSRSLWWLIIGLTILVVFLIGFGVSSWAG